ncbi:MAG TPA: hypothetical protein VF807_15950 [Ktedonobacterales bacterium]
MLVLHVVAILAGALIIAGTIMSAVRTFIVPRAGLTHLTRWVFIALRAIFDLFARLMRSYEQIDRLFALYAPIGLLLLPAAWLFMVGIGFTLIYWGLGVGSLYVSYVLSGSSLFTLGFANPIGWSAHTVLFAEGAVGLGLITLLISYLPTMYSAYSRREALVTLLEIRAGTPPSALEMLRRYKTFHGLDHLSEVWTQWEEWFVEMSETHTSLTAIALFRSPHPYRSWVTAAGTVLDCAALLVSTVDTPTDPHVHLCIRAGYLALNNIASQFNIKVPAHPTVEKNAISISREDFEKACDKLIMKGLAVKADRDKAWQDYAGWRVNYDVALLALCRLFIAPITAWSSDRAWHGTPHTSVARVMSHEGLRSDMS